MVFPSNFIFGCLHGAAVFDFLPLPRTYVLLKINFIELAPTCKADLKLNSRKFARRAGESSLQVHFDVPKRKTTFLSLCNFRTGVEHTLDRPSVVSFVSTLAHLAN